MFPLVIGQVPSFREVLVLKKARPGLFSSANRDRGLVALVANVASDLSKKETDFYSLTEGD